MKISILSGFRSLVIASSWNAYDPRLHVDFSSKFCSMQSYVLFQNIYICITIESKNYSAVDIVFSNARTNLDRAAGFQNDANITKLQRMVSDMVSKVVQQNHGRGSSTTELEELRSDFCACKPKVIILFSMVRTFDIFTPELHLLNDLIENVSRFGVCLPQICRDIYSSIAVAKLLTLTYLDDVQHVWMNWYSI